MHRQFETSRSHRICLVGIVIATVALTLTRADAQSAARERWFATWTASQYATPPRPAGDSVDRVPTFVNRTIRQIVHTSLGGERARIRVSNEYGDRPLVIGSAHMGLRASGAKIVVGSDRTVTFSGRTSVTIRPGSTLLSDPVTLDIPMLSDVAVSLYFPDSARLSTVSQGLQTNYVSHPGDFAGTSEVPIDRMRYGWMFLCGLDVANERATGTIVAFGASTTLGGRSTPNENRTWPEVLARRVLTSGAEPPKAVVNAGIGSNRLLWPTQGQPSGLARFDRDVLMQPGVTHVIIQAVLTDIWQPLGAARPQEMVSAGDIIFGLQQLAARAHYHGLAVVAATITPDEGRDWGDRAHTHEPNAEVEAKRQAVNAWIRSSGIFDGIVDFDLAVRDPSHPTRLLPMYDSGDHGHYNDAGYKAIAESFDLTLFRTARR